VRRSYSTIDLYWQSRDDAPCSFPINYWGRPRQYHQAGVRYDSPQFENPCNTETH